VSRGRKEPWYCLALTGYSRDGLEQTVDANKGLKWAVTAACRGGAHEYADWTLTGTVAGQGALRTSWHGLEVAVMQCNKRSCVLFCCVVLFVLCSQRGSSMFT
jgi:hypothetical protein